MLATTAKPAIADAVALLERETESKTTEELDNLSSTLDLTLEEFFRFQELKSVAAGGVLESADAMYIYRQLGGTPDVFNSRSFAVKYVLTRIFQKLLELNMGR